MKHPDMNSGNLARQFVKHGLRVLLAVVVAASFTSCGGKVFYSSEQVVDEHCWPMHKVLNYDVEVVDTAQLYNFFVDLRLTEDYPYANTFLFIGTTFPDGSVAMDTLECPVAAPDGRWLGKRSGRYIDNRYYFHKTLRFPMQGTYRFGIEQALRDSCATGFKAVGFRIEQADISKLKQQ